MAETIGVRELKTHASEILKCVREEGASYTVTHRGRAIARLTPMRSRWILGDEDDKPFESVEEVLAAFDALAAEIAEHIPPGEEVSAVDMVREQRRDL